MLPGEVHHQHEPGQVPRTLDSMERFDGYVPGFRRQHSRGVAFRGQFTAAPEAPELTIAEHLQGHRVPVVVRLSNSNPIPYAADRLSAHRGRVLGLAIRFELAGGDTAEWAAINIADFPARTPDEFAGILSAQRPELPGRLPNPLRLVPFLALHPQCLAGLKAILTVKTAPSFATNAFHGLHAYYAVDTRGTRRAFRYRWMPLAAPAGISSDEDRTLPPQYLVSELKLRVAREPVGWDLVFQMAEPGDPVDDVTEHWPPERSQVTMGRLLLDRVHESQDLVEASVFDPTNVPPGVELSEDPLLPFRAACYRESHHRRLSETKPEIKPE